MRRFITALVLTSVLVLPLSSTNSQRKSVKSKKDSIVSLASLRGVESITAAQLRDYLSFIASDEMEGRDTPSRGLDLTAKFIALNLSRWGFKPAGDDGTYLQKMALRRDTVDKAQTRVQLNGQTITFGDDYIPSSAPGNITGQMVFAGNGWFVKARNIDAYKGINAAGKIVVIFAAPYGLPAGISRADMAGKRGEDWMGQPNTPQKQGAVGIVTVPDFQFLANWDRNLQRATERGATVVEKFQPLSGSQLPGIIASPQLANLLFMGEKQNASTIFEGAYGGGEMPASFELNPEKKISIAVAAKGDPVATQNVVAIFEGSDPLLKNEYVALGAHYDHVGIGNPANGDAIYNGADDDGSGTTTLLAIAEALASAQTKPKRSVLFVWHAGEEKVLWGSRYFHGISDHTAGQDCDSDQHRHDRPQQKRKVTQIPETAELSGPNEIYVIGSKMMSTELGDLSAMVNKDYLNLSYNYRYDDPSDPNRFFFRSDHYNYARKGIPIIFFFDGEHEDYHRPGDSADKIDYQKMEQVARTVCMTLWELANRPARPKVDKQLPAELMRD